MTGVWFLKRFNARVLTLEICCLSTSVITQIWDTYTWISELSNMLTSFIVCHRNRFDWLLSLVPEMLPMCLNPCANRDLIWWRIHLAVSYCFSSFDSYTIVVPGYNLGFMLSLGKMSIYGPTWMVTMCRTKRVQITSSKEKSPFCKNGEDNHIRKSLQFLAKKNKVTDPAK